MAVAVFAIFTGDMPFQGKDAFDLDKHILRGSVAYPLAAKKTRKALANRWLRACFERKPDRRIAASCALNHK